jgi:3-isopropylmalate/(R)-2-methylmalate dehydratase small subunit
MVYKGTAHTFGDSINTDYITPTEYLSQPIEQVAEHIFEPIAPDFYNRFDSGDIIIAGENFGSGSSREHAPKALKAAEVSVVVAESFARIFYRNGIAIGLPVVTCPGVSEAVVQGDTVAIDFAEQEIRNESTGTSLETEPMPEEIRAIYDVGGLLSHYQRHPEGLSMSEKN